MQYTVYGIQYTVYSLQYTVYSIQYTIYRIQYTVYSLQYTLYSMQYTEYSTHNTVHSCERVVPLQCPLHSWGHQGGTKGEKPEREENPKGLDYISQYIPTRVTIQIFSIHYCPSLEGTTGRVVSPYCSGSWGYIFLYCLVDKELRAHIGPVENSAVATHFMKSLTLKS